MGKSVYILEEYSIYDKRTILLISNDYRKVKTYLNKILKDYMDKNMTKKGFLIYKYDCDVEYSSKNKPKGCDWFLIDCDGEVKDYTQHIEVKV